MEGVEREGEPAQAHSEMVKKQDELGEGRGGGGGGRGRGLGGDDGCEVFKKPACSQRRRLWAKQRLQRAVQLAMHFDLAARAKGARGDASRGQSRTGKAV